MKKRNPTICLIALILLALPGSGLAEMIRTPWLQAVGQSSAFVLVEDTDSLPLAVDYGPTGHFGLTALSQSQKRTSADTLVHHVRLDGLLPATVYRYRARDIAGVSTEYTLKTAPGSDEPVRFAWAADSRGNPRVFNLIAGLMAQFRPDFVLHGGDVVDSNSYRCWEQQFFVANWSQMISRVAFYLAPGNHEGWNTQVQAFTQAPASSSGCRGYYSFDYGPVHFLVLNTELDRGPGSAQYRFAASDLEASGQPWKIVIAHKPAWSVGQHGGDEQMQRLTDDVFETNGVSLVIAGHNHFYQRCYRDGIHHLTMGSAGADLHDPGRAWYVRRSARSYHCGLFEATPRRLNLTVLDESGHPIDWLELTR